MKTTMIIYESHHGSAKKAAMILGTIIGNSRVFAVDEAPEIITFDHIVIVFSFYGLGTAKATVEYLKKIKDQVTEKPLAVIGIGLARADLPGFSKKISEAIDEKEFESFFSEGELRISKLTDLERAQLANFYERYGMELVDNGNFDTAAVADIGEKLMLRYQIPKKPLPKELLKVAIENFIKTHNTVALATGKGDWIRCTPLEYFYLNGVFYIISEGGLKYKGLWQNENISAGIYDEFHTMSNLKGMQITGKAEFVKIRSKEYLDVFAKKNISQKKLDQLPVTLYLIRINPVKYEMLNSAFKKDGFDVRQILDLSEKKACK